MTQLKEVIGFGVAGNFTGHLEQAGEAADFVDLKTSDANAPKGLFPFYVPADGDHFLHVYPLSGDRIQPPQESGNLQIEPELGLLCNLDYKDGLISRIQPTHFGAHNDCSIRRPGARKISEKKNWGAHSKGFAPIRLPIDRFAPGGILDRYRIACLLKRGGDWHTYGVDSPVNGYTYFYETLLDWVVQRLNSQQDEGPLEDMAHWLRVAGRPSRALMSVGATRYTDYGETTFLQTGDESFVLVYDADKHDLAGLRDALDAEQPPQEGLSLLHQKVG